LETGKTRPISSGWPGSALMLWSFSSRPTENIFEEGEWVRSSAVAESAPTAADGKTCRVGLFNPNGIIHQPADFNVPPRRRARRANSPEQFENGLAGVADPGLAVLRSRSSGPGVSALALLFLRSLQLSPGFVH
jgi:hypothetical protein